MKSISKTVMAGLVAFGLTVGAASNAAAEFKYRSGTTQCGFNHFTRLGGTEDHFSTINLRNPNGDVTIKVDRMRIFLANGAQLSEVPGNMLPILGPHQSVSLRSWDYWAQMGLPPIPSELRPFQLLIEWSVQDHGRGYHLGANVVRLVRVDFNGEEKSRHRGSCRHLELSLR